MNTDLHFSSQTNEWATPQDFFDRLNTFYLFTLDPCATSENAKCARFFTEAEDGFMQPWAPERVFMNPPYGRAIGKWVKKAYEESLRGATVVCLIPARTDTKWFHSFIWGKAANIVFVQGRIKFGGHSNAAPFPSMVVTYAPFGVTETKVKVMSASQLSGAI